MEEDMTPERIPHATFVSNVSSESEKIKRQAVTPDSSKDCLPLHYFTKTPFIYK